LDDILYINTYLVLSTHLGQGLNSPGMHAHKRYFKSHFG